MFLVVFRNRKRADMDAATYGADADAMLALAQRQPGFRSFKSYTAEDGEVVAVSEWESSENAREWGRHLEHIAVQKRGRQDYYASYTLFACDEPRVHHFDAGDCK